jgi:hypothetical protein
VIVLIYHRHKLLNVDIKEKHMPSGTWNVSSLYRARSLKPATRQLAKYKLDLMGVEEVRCNRGGLEPAGDYTFFYENGIENNELGTGFCVCKRITKAIINRRCGSEAAIIQKTCFTFLHVKFILRSDVPEKGKVNEHKYSFHSEISQA